MCHPQQSGARLIWIMNLDQWGLLVSRAHSKQGERRALPRVRQLENHCIPAVNVWYSDKLNKSPFVLEPIRRRRWTTKSKAA